MRCVRCLKRVHTNLLKTRVAQAVAVLHAGWVNVHLGDELLPGRSLHVAQFAQVAFCNPNKIAAISASLIA